MIIVASADGIPRLAGSALVGDRGVAGLGADPPAHGRGAVQKDASDPHHG